VVFATVAIPLALDARWTSAAWALEGAAIVWVGARQKRTLARGFGLLLQFAAGLAYLEGYGRMGESMPLVDAPFVGAVLIAFAGMWTSRLLKREGLTKVEPQLAPFVFAWGLLWWLFAGHHEIIEFIPRAATLNAHVGLLAATAMALGLLALRWDWNEAAWGARLLLPALIPFVSMSIVGHRHPFAYYGWLAWPAAIAVHLWILKRLEPASARRDVRFVYEYETY